MNPDSLGSTPHEAIEQSTVVSHQGSRQGSRPVRPAGRFDHWWPTAGVRIQLVSAAAMWLIGGSILIVRGLTYIHDRSWHSWALAAAIVLGVGKAHLLLNRVAAKAVRRIYARGSAFYLGFFSLTSWLLVALMMGGGIILRHLVVHPGKIGAGIMGALYVGIGIALLIADSTFWVSVVRGEPKAE